jgi:predicted NBD/HSP70 family sugar kinase
MQEKPLRASDLRVHNQNIVLSRIHAAGIAGTSQSELVQATGLKAPTIFRIFSSLEEQGLIEPLSNDAEEGAQAKKGRRPVNFRVCKDARYTIGVEFWSAYLSIGVFDFLGNRIHSVVQPLANGIDADEVLRLIVSQIRSMVGELAIPTEWILGVGVAAPGQVDLKHDTVTYYPRIAGMQNLPIVERLEHALSLPVVLHNNCSALAFGEYRYGGFDHADSLFSFLLRTGVNGSFVHDDVIYTNSKQMTIETGHIPVDVDGPRCSCGSRGCLQAFLQELDPDSADPRLSLFEGLDRKLQEHDPQAMDIIGQASRYLAIAMKAIMRILAPRSFLFIGCSATVSQAITDQIRQQLQESDLFESTPPRIFSAAYDPLLAQKGASDLVLSRFFQ